MTRYVVDAGAVIHMVREGIAVSDEHSLLAPTLLRSQVLSSLHESVAQGELTPEAGLDLVARVGRLPIRLLGDGVLRRHAWKVAEQLGWASTYAAEYVALTRLQADAFVTLDADLTRSLQGVVKTASIAELR